MNREEAKNEFWRVTKFGGYSGVFERAFGIHFDKVVKLSYDGGEFDAFINKIFDENVCISREWAEKILNKLEDCLEDIIIEDGNPSVTVDAVVQDGHAEEIKYLREVLGK